MTIQIHPLRGFPLVRPGDDLVSLILQSLDHSAISLQAADILVVTQKIVSKAEGCYVKLDEVSPSDKTLDLAGRLGLHPKRVEVILRESRRVIRAQVSPGLGRGVLICETHHGFVCANAGVDESNLSESDSVLALPRDPDASAGRIRSGLLDRTGMAVGVVVSDSFGRPWRRGLVNVAIGLSGISSLVDYQGKKDYGGRSLAVTQLAVADEVAAAAGMAMGKLELIPAALVRGVAIQSDSGRAAELIRPASEDFFRE